MRVLELFSGSGIMSKTFKKQGHETFTIDNNPKLKPNLVKDIMQLQKSDIPFKPDIIWASPPCTCFSVAGIGHHFYFSTVPKTDSARESIQVIKKTVQVIKELKPKYWFIENPVGMLRKLHLIKDLQPLRRILVTYCQYGENRRKPTDIWTNCMTWNPKSPCKNGDKCHDAAPRSSKNTGTQALKNTFDRGKIPQALCLEIIKSCEA